MQRAFWEGRHVLLTGHTGFKGAWMNALLDELGAQVSGLSLPADQEPALSELIARRYPIAGHMADLSHAPAVAAVVEATKPQIVIHMAAQAQVRRSYNDPVRTYASNVMGTLHLLEALRRTTSLEAVLVVTSDKVYLNAEHGRPFAESDPLGGSDPYSASKAACEVLVRSHAESFFAALRVPLATARAGNVIGGGDWSVDRLVPDIYRAAIGREAVRLRYPDARRPWQHVLDCCSGYLLYVEHLARQREADPPSLNFGPRHNSTSSVAELASAMIEALGGEPWARSAEPRMPEKQTLSLNSSLAEATLGWSPRLDLEATIAWTAEWYHNFRRGEAAADLVARQITRYREMAP
ncbi:MAG: rfbG [Microvirga sp.]|jgi:CDP-glucose 4,6-dehydratase|nr:rfbG [Microvirga sp.]